MVTKLGIMAVAAANKPEPTQAQIEAVEDVLRGLVIITGDSTWDMNYVAHKVLAVAAEVGERKTCPHCGKQL